MAKKSITSLTEDKCRSLIKGGAYRAELGCDSITGFHLQKLKTGGSYRFRYRDIVGKARIMNLGAYIDGRADRIDAAKQASVLRGAVESGGDPAGQAQRQQATLRAEHIVREVTTVGAYLEGSEMLYQWSKANHGAHNLNFIRKNFKDWLNIPIADITKEDLKAWEVKMRTKEWTTKVKGVEVKKTGYSQEYIQRVLGAFKSMLKRAGQPIIDFKLSSEDSGKKRSKLDGSSEKTRRLLTNDELQGIMRGMEIFKADCLAKLAKDAWERDVPYWFYPFFYLAYYTGLRVGDLYTLNWDELNLNFKQLNTYPNKTQHHSSAIKVSHSLNDHLVGILKEWHKQQGAPTGSKLVFPPDESRITKVYADDDIITMDKKLHNKHWKRILKLGNVESELDFYSLRHHFCSKLVTAGLPLLTVARLAGHKSQRMIEQHYGHLSPHAATDAMNIMGNDLQLLGNTAIGAQG